MLQCNIIELWGSIMLPVGVFASHFITGNTCEVQQGVSHSLTIHKYYITKRRTLIQVLLSANVYTKFRFMHIHLCIFTHAYMHEQITKEFEGWKYLYECMPFGSVNPTLSVHLPYLYISPNTLLPQCNV